MCGARLGPVLANKRIAKLQVTRKARIVQRVQESHQSLLLVFRPVAENVTIPEVLLPAVRSKREKAAKTTLAEGRVAESQPLMAVAVAAMAAPGGKKLAFWHNDTI